MHGLALFGIVAVLVLLFVVTELTAAVLPLLLVVTMVPPEERRTLADLIAATDSSHRIRFWPALRVAVGAQRLSRARNRGRDSDAWAERDRRRISDPIGRWRGSPR
jgi:hypothetical protein